MAVSERQRYVTLKGMVREVRGSNPVTLTPPPFNWIGWQTHRVLPANIPINNFMQLISENDKQAHYIFL